MVPVLVAGFWAKKVEQILVVLENQALMLLWGRQSFPCLRENQNHGVEYPIVGDGASERVAFVQVLCPLLSICKKLNQMNSCQSISDLLCSQPRPSQGLYPGLSFILFLQRAGTTSKVLRS